MAPARVVVVGGGIAGLSAALRLCDRLGGEVAVTVVDGADRLGGKLRTGWIGDRLVETGAETFLAREPDDRSGSPSAAVLLAHRVGLASALRHPATTAASVLVDGAMRPIPAGTLMGIPADDSTVDWPATGTDRDLGYPVLPDGRDVSVGSLVRARIGDAVVDRLVDPLLGGVYAGRADDLSLAVTMPGLAAACRIEHTLRSAVRATLGRRAGTPGPAFATIDGGLSRLVDAIVEAMPGVSIRRGLLVRELVPHGNGWWVTLGSTRDPEVIEADAVILAVPSHPAARLLAGVSAEAAQQVGMLDYASIGLVTYLLPAGALDGTGLADRSGALIPAIEGRVVKAITVFSTKWAAQPDGAVLLRASVGRYGDEQVLQYHDESLIEVVAADLSAILDRPLATPLAAMVTRWGGALPQYRPGHADRVASARTLMPPTLALAGAAYDGIGIPVCIRSGERAADQLADALAGLP